MAVDTRNKRHSVANHGLPFMALGPLPDGTIGMTDRAHLAWLYSGITVSQATGVVVDADVAIRLLADADVEL